MPQIHILSNDQPLGILIRENRAPRSLRLSHNVGRAWVVEKAVVDAARVPGVDALGPAERGVADERVPAAVVVACIVVGAEMVFLQGGRGVSWFLGDCRGCERGLLTLAQYNS